jgi:hypothetical protein
VSRSLDPQLLAEAEARLADVHGRIERACAAAGRSPSEITLVGACKRQPIDRIAALVCAGLRELGENYVQAAEATRPLLEQRLGDHFAGAPAPSPAWRMIGHLQRNKAAAAVEVFRAVDTVDTGRLARALARRAEALGGVVEVCLQVNLSGEPSKSGCSEDGLSELLADCAPLRGLRVVGLMTLPPADPEAARSAFARLRDLRGTLSREPGGHTLHHLNMGMSGDLEVAIEEGSTVVRVGTDLFGDRVDASLEHPADAR